MKKNLRKLGAYALLGVAALLSLKGRFDIGIFVAGIGAWMLGHDSLAGLVQRAVGAPAQRARVRARIVEVEIDPQSGITGGMVLAGALAGRALDSLSEAELKSFLAQAAESDPDALGLLEPYLDRRLAGWRETFDADLYRRRADAAQRGAQAGVMASQEAQQILGLQPGAARARRLSPRIAR